jgi:alkanesulfonate monooxygenase SsuD/methylene tetrahydromethanopterin reductase-like flavin-dependent oxidoreductase (luciferase family)
LRVCLMIEGQEGVAWDDWVALAQAAEEVGLDGLFRSDHYTSFHGPPGGALDAWATLAALSPMTQRLRLGTLVSPTTFRHPSELARVTVTADHASNGRIEVGVGAGWFEVEHRQNGFAFPRPPERLDRLSEYLEILVRSWSAETFDFRGQHFQLESQRALPAPVQVPHPPLILGGRGGRRSLGLAAVHAEEYNVSFVGLEECQRLHDRLAAVCERAGRNPTSLRFSLMMLAALGDTEIDAQERLSRMLERFRVSRDRCLVGTVSQVADELAQLEAMGVSRVFLQHPDRADHRGIQLMGELRRVLNR